MLRVLPISSAAGFTVTIDYTLPTLSSDLANEVEVLWQAEQKHRGKAIFNGRIMSALMVDSLGIHGCVTEYRYLIAQRARPELFPVLQVRPVAVSGLFKCADGIVFGRRSGMTTQDAGLWELVPSGGIDTREDKVKQLQEKVDYLAQILTELHEETGIGSDAVLNVRPFCLVDDTDSHVLDIGIAMISSLSANEVLRMHGEATAKEYDELRVIPLSEVEAFIQGEASQLVGVSMMLIQHFFEPTFI